MKIVSFYTKPKSSTRRQGGESSGGRPPRKSPRRRKRKNYRPLILLGTVLGIILIAVAAQQLLRAKWQDDANLTYIDGIPVYEDFLEEGTPGRPGEKRRIKYVVIHETDNVKEGANAEGHNRFIHSNGATQELSWHYTVDDHEIWHHIPDDETAFHAGDHMEENGGNKNGIGVEMCVNADGDYEQTLRNTQKLAARLLHEYGLTMEDLKKHQDFSGKHCPSKLLDADRWEEFRQGVEKELLAIEE